MIYYFFAFYGKFDFVPSLFIFFFLLLKTKTKIFYTFVLRCSRLTSSLNYYRKKEKGQFYEAKIISSKLIRTVYQSRFVDQLNKDIVKFLHFYVQFVTLRTYNYKNKQIQLIRSSHENKNIV